MTSLRQGCSSLSISADNYTISPMHVIRNYWVLIPRTRTLCIRCLISRTFRDAAHHDFLSPDHTSVCRYHLAVAYQQVYSTEAMPLKPLASRLPSLLPLVTITVKSPKLGLTSSPPHPRTDHMFASVLPARRIVKVTGLQLVRLILAQHGQSPRLLPPFCVRPCTPSCVR